MDYHQTLEFLFNQLPMYQRIGAAAYKADLDTTLHLSELLGNPHELFPSIHIAGTNGKGSVAHMLASVLQEAGYRTGLYTSPHLVDFRERIRINGEMIPPTEVVRFVEEYRSLFETIKPSFFEYTFGMAMACFANQEVDIAIVETGMGGRLDSTNIIRPLVSVITNIGLDHTRFLGSSLPEIAVEKAGIIKEGIPVVIGERHVETTAVFRSHAAELSAPILFAEDFYTACYTNDLDSTNGIRMIQLTQKLSGNEFLLELPFDGSYQLKNLLSVGAVTDYLAHVDFHISRNAFLAGLKNTVSNTGIAGRWQVLGQKPTVICDTGHNREGLQLVVEQLRTLSYDRLHIVFGTVEDKDLSAILMLLPANAEYYFCKADIPRGLDQHILHQQADLLGLAGTSFDSVRNAFDAAKTNAGCNDLIFVGGSTFVVAEVLQGL